MKEIIAQNKDIGTQNEKLAEAKQIIEDQNNLILKKNDELTEEVNRQTQGLKQAKN